MNTRYIAATAAALVLATVGATSAMAADASATSALGADTSSTQAAEPSTKTRAQVLAELHEAQRTGDDYRLGVITMKMREAYPDRYPQSAPVVAKAK